MLTRLGRYEVDELLARGGMGEVYLARLTAAHGFTRPVVIKTIRTELVANERTALMFVDEARMAAGLHHRNIVQIVDFDRFDDGAFIVSELVDGCDLWKFLQHVQRPPAYEIAVTIACELGTGLHAAHEATGSDGAPLGLVHRDVSPSNVLLGKLGEIKLSDFGVAKARQRSYHTVSGTIKGKAPYMAPEQILGETIDRRADVFSLGVLLFEVSTRTRLYSASADARAMKQILDGTIPDPAERRHGYPPELAEIVRRALARDRDRRYPTAAAMVDDLDALAKAKRWTLSCAAVGEIVKTIQARMRRGSKEQEIRGGSR
ncbi:MAG: serine/threonine protein kinase [Myxococcota bacterium]|nr:serine/threonine protein kinase [Deltaproteobacteria bacterium]MDQ3340041.1 serine/threonine protein kinase [Myxococcota bacterium]